MKGDLILSGEHPKQYAGDVLILQNCTFDVYNFINQSHPNIFNLKRKKKK